MLRARARLIRSVTPPGPKFTTIVISRSGNPDARAGALASRPAGPAASVARADWPNFLRVISFIVDFPCVYGMYMPPLMSITAPLT